MSDQSRHRHLRPSQHERNLRCVSTHLNLTANRLESVNQDFLNLARSQLQAFNSLQHEVRDHQDRPRPLSRSCSPSVQRSTHQEGVRLRTPLTPRRPSSDDSEMLPDAQEIVPHSPTPSVIGWDSYVADSRRQRVDQYIPNYTEHPTLSSRHCRTPERARSNSHAIWRPQHGSRSQRDRTHQEPAGETPPTGENRRGGARGRARRHGGQQRPRPLHERIRFE